MRPLRLRVEGFGAYLEAQEVSFDDVELFAITGPTGSGKTTLLDAITFALYRETPRIGAKGFGELKHPGAELGRVELQFGAGDELWRVVRVLGRENQHRLERFEQGVWRVHKSSEKVRELDLQIARLVGMDYATFTRAILLPQGQFDSFLRGAPKDRRDTLIKLYGLERLKEMRERVGKRLSEARAQAARLEGELSGLEAVDEAGIAQLGDEARALKEREAEIESQVSRKERDLKTKEEKAAKFAEHQSLARSKARLESEAAGIAGLRQKLDLAEQAERLYPQVKSYQAAVRELEENKKKHTGALEEVEQLKKAAQEARSLYDPEGLETTRAELAKLPLLEGQEAKLKRLGGDLSLSQGNVLVYDEDRLEALREAERKWDELERAEKNYHTAHSRLKEQKERTEKRGDQVRLLTQEEEALLSQGKAAKLAHEQAAEALQHAEKAAGILAHRQDLKEGEICPLCEQKIAKLPSPADLPDLDELRRRTTEAEVLLRQLREKYQEKKGQKSALSETLPQEHKRIEELTQELEQLGIQVESIKKDLAGFGGRAQLAEERSGRLAGLAREILKATSGKSVAGWAGELKQKAKILEEGARKLAETEARLQSATTATIALSEAIKATETNLARLKEVLGTAAATAGFSDLGQIEAARLSPLERSALSERIQKHQSELEYVHKRLKALDAELGKEQPVSAEEVFKLRGELEALRAAAKETHGRRVGLEAELARLASSLKRRRELLSAKAGLDAQIDTWERLSRDLQGDRFQDYLLEKYQAGLLRRASELMAELSGGRYRFKLQEGEYLVQDCWTESERPVRTLSGGESFLASLSLALSLSEHLSKGRIGALFLDEGFGTLDTDTLDQVAGVLEALPTRGRLVGVVTHVEALAERLPARLVVEKHPSGSKISWRD